MRTMIMEAYQSAFTKDNSQKTTSDFIKKPGGSREESGLIKGIVLKKEKSHPNMPDRLKNLRIAITSEKPGINRLELKMKGEGPTPIRLNVKSADQMAALQGNESQTEAGAA